MTCIFAGPGKSVQWALEKNMKAFALTFNQEP